MVSGSQQFVGLSLQGLPRMGTASWSAERTAPIHAHSASCLLPGGRHREAIADITDRPARSQLPPGERGGWEDLPWEEGRGHQRAPSSGSLPTEQVPSLLQEQGAWALGVALAGARKVSGCCSAASEGRREGQATGPAQRCHLNVLSWPKFG